MKWDDMDETPHRASQICRVLGSPKSYQILMHLRRNGASTVGDIAKAVNRHHSTVSIALKSLREVNLVRFTRSGAKTFYKLKVDEVGAIQDHLEKLVKMVRKQP